ncbi:SMI1/KNR4 family protein [Deinococcus ficus]|uniref:SMI1/KNR4 family protein n=1 Tax=Deinococcus ficus TaxID=317577 RepID=UPI0003B57AC8|nr:SMI1/KNR4 family protein [Deinococcus ficus]
MSSPHSSQIAVLVDLLQRRSDCVLHPSRGLPELTEGHSLPPDLREFYTLCGGASLHEDADHSCELRAPENFKQANAVILSELTAQDQHAHLPPDHCSWGWYILAEFGTPSELIAINCSSPQEGICYRCGWVTYPNPRQVAAPSFTALLQRLVADEGRTFWEELFDQP